MQKKFGNMDALSEASKQMDEQVDRLCIKINEMMKRRDSHQAIILNFEEIIRKAEEDNQALRGQLKMAQQRMHIKFLVTPFILFCSSGSIVLVLTQISSSLGQRGQEIYTPLPGTEHHLKWGG